MPALNALVIGDSPGAWRDAGFLVDADTADPDRGTTAVGGVEVRLVGGGQRGILSWELDDGGSGQTIDGVKASTSSARASGLDEDLPAYRDVAHPNLIDGIDHVVMTTPDLDRTMVALAEAGFDARRTRDVPGMEPARRQVFYWAGPTIIELVGPVEPSGDGPAALWGLAVTSADLDQTARVLGSRLGPVKDAVQAGRRIATLRTEQLDLSVPMAVMSPHPRRGRRGSTRSI